MSQQLQTGNLHVEQAALRVTYSCERCERLTLASELPNLSNILIEEKNTEGREPAVNLLNLLFYTVEQDLK